jgi:co-chaperonin GroES (HSP10)
MKIGKIYNGFVVLIQDKASNTTKTGLTIPDSVVQKMDSGVIVAKRDEFGFEVGDRVLFASMAAAPIKVDDQEMIVVREVDVYCSLEG